MTICLISSGRLALTFVFGVKPAKTQLVCPIHICSFKHLYMLLAEAAAITAPEA